MFGADLSAMAPTGRITYLFPGLYQRKRYLAQIVCDLELDDFHSFESLTLLLLRPMGCVTSLADDHIDSKR